MIAKTKNAPNAANVGALVQQASKKTDDIKVRADLSVITSITPSILTKKHRLNDLGEMVTDTVAQMVEGKAINLSVSSAQALGNLLDSLEHNQAVTWGIHTAAQAEIDILSTNLFTERGEPASATTRTDNHYRWGSNHGVMMLDCDDKTLSKEAFIEAINDIIPLDNVAHVWRPSSSSYIYNGNDQVNGLTGQRLYLFVKDAEDMLRAGKALFNRLWLNAKGHYEIGKAGSYLERAPIDAAVFQASRLDFAARSYCIAPLEQRPVPTEYNEGHALDTKTALPELTAKQVKILAEIKIKEKEPYADKVKMIRDVFSHDRAFAHLTKQGIKVPTEEQIKAAKINVLRALNMDVLLDDFIITLADGKQISIAEALDDPEQYHEALTKDPLEPSYDNYHDVGKLYLQSQRPRLYSMAHGGKIYKLFRQPRRIEHVAGRMTDTTLKTLKLMRSLPDYYDMGDNLVSVKNGKVSAFSEPLLEHELGAIAQFWQWHKTGKATYERLIDPPQKVIRQILAMHKHRQLKSLNAVINAPTITHNDHVVTKHGYDVETQLYLDCSDHGVTIPMFVSKEDAIAAYHKLMKPFCTFDYADNVSRSVALSAVLTAVTRPTQATAPAFAFDAPKQGSGKTYFCECLGILATNESLAMTPSIEKNEDEVRKMLLSMLIEGRRLIVWDNIMGAFNSATMASFLTSERFSGRILGFTQSVEVSHRAMLLLTGNNMTLVGDMPRRVLTCRFDTGIENPTQAKRDLSAIDGLKPSTYIKRNRYKLVAAAIILIRGYLQSDEYQRGGMVSDRLSSFEEWDITCRQPIIWLAQHLGGLTDPKRSIDDNMEKDPEHETLCELLTGIYEWQASAPFTARALSDYMTRQICSDHPLHEVLIDLNGGNSLTTRSIGNLLKNRRGRIAAGLKLELAKASTKGNSFKVRKVS
ncbi:MAG: hypothetical protein WBB40_02360 [Psychrobacter alimentarius]